jgi:hypothetical protein
MNRGERPRESTIVRLALVGGLLFLASGGVAWFLRAGSPGPPRGDRPDDAPAASRPAPAGGSTGDPARGRAPSPRRASSPRRRLRPRPPRSRSSRSRDASSIRAGGRSSERACAFELRDRNLPPPSSQRPRADAPAFTTTDDGEFAFAGPRPRDRELAVALFIDAPDHAAACFESRRTAAAKRLDVGDARAGRRRRPARPRRRRAPAAASRARRRRAEPASGRALAWRAEPALAPIVSADSGGFYELAHLASGSYRVTARAPGMQAGRSREAVLVEEGGLTELDPIALAAGHEVAGRVLGLEDRPVAGAQVRVRGAGGRSRIDESTTTGPDGRFRSRSAGAGPGRRRGARAAGSLRAVVADVDASTALDVVVRLRPGLAARGVVVDGGSGAPVARFAARLRPFEPATAGANAQTRILRRHVDALRDPKGCRDVGGARAQRGAWRSSSRAGSPRSSGTTPRRAAAASAGRPSVRSRSIRTGASSSADSTPAPTSSDVVAEHHAGRDERADRAARRTRRRPSCGSR